MLVLHENMFFLGLAVACPFQRHFNGRITAADRASQTPVVTPTTSNSSVHSVLSSVWQSAKAQAT